MDCVWSIGKCGLLGGSAPLGEGHSRPSSLSLPPACGSEVSSQLLLQCLACCLPAIMHPTMMVMRSLSQTLSNSSIKCFLMSVSLVMMFLNRNRLVSKTQAINYLILISILRNKVKIVKGNYGSNLHNKGNTAQSATAEGTQLLQCRSRGVKLHSPIPAWPTIHDNLIKSITPQMFNIQRTWKRKKGTSQIKICN